MSPIPTPAPTSTEPLLRHRGADVTVRMTWDGVPITDREVLVAQRTHRFLFGCVGFEFMDLADEELAPEGRPEPGEASAAPAGSPPGGSREHAERWFDVFNFATLPFYWGLFEPVRGRPHTQRVLRAARWFTERGCVVKGHPLAWHTLAPDWLRELPPEEAAAAQVARIHREMRDFEGLIDTWDVINEVVIMPLFTKDDNALTPLCRRLGRIPLIRMVFDAAREANPRATLILNDFDMSAAYECLIEGVLEAGIHVDALGLQSHMHQGYWGEEKTLRVLERFSRYGLPIHFTETTLVSGDLMPAEIDDLNDYQVPAWPSTPEGEERQADEVVRHYRTLLGHPSVQATTYWGLTDGGWLGAPGGFLHADGTPKPSYQALRSLIRGEWWLEPSTTRTDQDGVLRFSGFLGRYELSVNGRTLTLDLDRPGEAGFRVDMATGAVAPWGPGQDPDLHG